MTVDQPSHTCSCGWRFFGDIKTVCPRCRAVTPITLPKWVRLFRILSIDADIGLGATAKRVAAKFGGERYKAWATRIGIPCGCADREQEWNRLYPNPNYRPPNA